MFSSGSWNPRSGTPARDVLRGCWPGLLRRKCRNLGREESAGKEKAVTNDFERRNLKFYPVTRGAGGERAKLGSYWK